MTVERDYEWLGVSSGMDKIEHPYMMAKLYWSVFDGRSDVRMETQLYSLTPDQQKRFLSDIIGLLTHKISAISRDEESNR